MSRPSHEVVLLVFALGMLIFGLMFCAVTVNWRQRTLLIWMLIPLCGGIGIGLNKGESLDQLLFSLGGGIPLLGLIMFVPPSRLRDYYRRKAAGENPDQKDYEPPQWTIWTGVSALIVWCVISFSIIGG